MGKIKQDENNIIHEVVGPLYSAVLYALQQLSENGCSQSFRERTGCTRFTLPIAEI